MASRTRGVNSLSGMPKHAGSDADRTGRRCRRGLGLTSIGRGTNRPRAARRTWPFDLHDPSLQALLARKPILSRF